MKIIFDKVSSPPGHSLTARDVKALFRLLPKEWTSSFNVVHFSSQLPDNSAFDRPVILSEYSGRLNICSRGLSPEKTIEEILIELLQRLPSSESIFGSNLRAHYANKLDKVQLKKIKVIIKPYLTEFMTMYNSEDNIDA